MLAVNPFASTRGIIGWDRDEHAASVARLVRASGAALGAVIDPDGEHLSLVDDTGHVLTDDEALLAFVALVAGHLGERRDRAAAVGHQPRRPPGRRPGRRGRSAPSCRTPR